MAIDREKVLATCDELAASGERVSFRTVYTKHGGNHSQMLAWWREWMDQHEPSPPLLPGEFVEAMSRFLAMDAWESRYQALQQQLVPEAEARLAQLDAQCHDAEERVQTLRSQITALVAERTTLRAEVAANRQALLAFVSGDDDGTTP